MRTDPLEPSLVHQAVSLFVGLSYPGGAPKKIISIVDSLATWQGDFFENPNFVRQQSENQSSYCLRLGCVHYPHMKMLVASWGGGDRYFFRVDAHDKHVIVPRDNPEYEALEQLRCKNHLMVEAIENAWIEAGLPTFTSCLNDDLAERVANSKR